ncbi:MAG: hypothetical protein LQ338_005906 [Usnochroma carphineum]|nr:MAG: hypothetical protein LQ338_005906 [Usnochroma carphineum]
MSKHATALPSINHVASLSGLPAELREPIYEELVNSCPSSLFNLLTVSRRISREVKPWIFKQPVVFEGQHSLFKWLAQVDPEYLPYVRAIRFKLFDIGPGHIVGSLGERLRRTRLQGHPKGIGNPYHEACTLELVQTLAALKSFKNLRSLTMLDCTRANPRPASAMIKELLDLILEELPLVTLNVPYGILFNTHYKSNEIEQLQIPHYDLVGSPGFPRELAPFCKLKALHTCSKSHGKGVDPYGSRKPIRIREKLPHLQELTMCLHEADEANGSEQTVHKALERHIVALAETAASLRTFRFWCNNWVGRTTIPMQQLIQFVQSSILEHIDTGYWWSPLPNQYPTSIVTISVRFDTNYRFLPNWFQKFHEGINPARPNYFTEYPHLREISLYLPTEAEEDLKDVATKQSVVAEICRHHGVRVRVIFGDFSCGLQV